MNLSPSLASSETASNLNDGVFRGLLCLWEIKVLHYYYSGGIPY